MRTNRTVAERVFAAFLSLVLVLGMFPVRTSAEETAAVYGNVVAATQGVTVSGNGTAEIAATNGNMTLNWIAANAEAGRNQDGWWVGLNLYAPAGMTAEQLKTVKYGYTADNLNLNFWEKKDSKDADQNHYIGLWGITNETYLKENKVTYDWYISWDGKSVQHIQLKLDPSKVVLKDAQGNGVYPVYGNVDAYTQGLTITGSGSEAVVVSNGNITLDWVAADESIGRVQDGWWVGVKVTAPAGLTEEQLKNAAYGRTPDALTGSFWNDKNSAPNAQLHYIDLWILVNETKLEQNKLNYDFYFCWDGTNVQKVQLKVDPSKVMLKDAQGNGVYPVYGTVAPISQGITVTSNGTEEVALTNSDITLQWVKADPSIGRNQDGWWIGLKVNAPAGMTAEQLQNSTYGYTAESMTKSFWSNKDSADTAQSHHIQVWCMTNETYLKEGKVTYNWYFNWDGKNVQHIQLKLDPAKVKLEESKTVGYGTVVAITPADAVISGGDSAITVAVEKAELTWVEADEKLGREAGWWVGIKAIAPEGFSENAQYAYVTDGVIGAGKPFATYKDGPNHIELWFKVTDTALVADADRKLTMNYAFDWNGNGIYEQTVQFYVNADGDIVLKNAAGQQVYPYFLGAVDAGNISTAVISGNETKTVTVDLGGHEIVWNNGWKVSVKASLDGQEKTITANFDSVDVTAADYTEEIDWNGDGLVDQTVKITGSVKLLKAEQEAPLFENGSAVTVSSYDLYEGYTNPVTNTGAGALTYSISENDYVSIDENGNVTVKNWNLLRGIKEAQKIATVTVGYEACDTHNASAVSSYDLTVSPKMDSKLTFEKNEVTVNYNDGTYANTLTAGVKDYTVTMVSSDPAIATVDNEGVVTFLQAGTVTITATADYNKWYTTTSVSYTLTIEKGEQEELKFVKPLDEVVYNPDGYDFDYSVQGGSGTGEVTYKSSAEEVASIDAAGKVTVHKAGEVTFTATKDEDACYLTATVSHTMTIDKANQEIVFATTDPAAITYAYGTVFENAVSNGDGSGKITYSFSCDTANSGSAIDAATGDLSVAAAGTYTVTAVKEEDDCYNGTEAIYTLVVNKAEQEIAFAEISGEHTLKNSAKAYTIEMNATEHCYNDGAVDYLFEIVGEKTATLSDTSVDAKTGVVTIGEGDYGTLTVKVTRPGDNRFLDWESSEFTLTIEQIDADANNFNFEGNKNKGYENGEWYCGPVTVTYEADGVKYQVSTDTKKTEKWSDSYTISEDGIYSDVKLSLKSTQEHGGVHYAQDVPTVKIDKFAPVSSISYDAPLLDKILNALTFGFYKERMEVTISSVDATSGLLEIAYKNAKDTEWTRETVSGNEDSISFIINPEYRDMIQFYATDIAGNEEEVKCDSRTVVVDSLNPVLEVKNTYDAPENVQLSITEGDIIYTQYNTTVNLTITEANFDLSLSESEYAPKVTVNDEVWEQQWNRVQETDKWTTDVVLEGDGDYELKVSYTDLSGNTMAEYSQKIRIDSHVPVITLEDKLNDLCTNGNVETTITIEEHNFNAADTTVMVKGVDIEGNVVIEEYAEKVTWTTVGDVHTAVINLTENAIYTVTVNSTDWAGNKAETASASFTLENSLPTNVSIFYSTPLLSKVMKALTFGYYQSEVEVTISAEDQFSGVDNFAWTYTREEGASTINVEQKSENIKYSQNGKSASVSFKLAASEVEQFRGSVSVVVTDKAGNYTEAVKDESNVIVVDNIAPEAKLAWNEAVTTLEEELTVGTLIRPVATRYYNEKAVATITITEANFYGEEVVIKHNGTVIAPDNATWTKHATEQDTWENTVTLTDAGDHVLEVTYTDRSGNKMEDITSELVVIDHTNPEISIDTADVNERHYYQEKQTRTITIEEHNFRESDVIFTISSKDSAGNDVAPNVDFSEWTHKDDVHTINLTFNGDANYNVDVSYVDLAGREAAKLDEQILTVDTVAPVKLEVSYGHNVFSEIIGNLFFCNHLMPMQVTVRAEDVTAGVDTFTCKATVRENVSGVNKEYIAENVKATHIGNNVYEATITIPAQFDGYFSFTAKDLAGRVSEEFTPKTETTTGGKTETVNQVLIVDTINPRTTVAYSEAVQTVDGVAYYDDTIVVTIRVEDANFRREYIGNFINVEVTRDGKAHPVHITWRDISADVHTGEFVLDKDGDYIVTITGNDPARNDMDEYKSHQLTLDTVLPTVEVTNVVANSANTDEVYTFEITASDINIDSATFKPVLTGIFRDADGKFVTKTIELGDMKEIKKNETYSFTVENLEEDAIYTLTCSVSDLAKNTYEKVMLKDEKEYEEVQFSINRNGSTYMLDDNTTELVGNYYVQNVNDNVVLIEINPDVLEEHSVTLNGRDLADGDDYSVREEGGNGSWMKYTYSVNKDLMADESEYNLVVSSEDKAGNKAFSDVKGASIGFVVDRTAPVVTVTGIHNDGRYQVESQTVTLIPMDPGGALKALSVYLVDDDGNVLQQLIDLSGEDLYNALEENEDQITFEIGEGLYQNVRVVCTDLAVDETGATNAYDETFTNISVSTSGFMIFWANKPLRYGVIFGTLGLAALALFLIFGKKKKV